MALRKSAPPRDAAPISLASGGAVAPGHWRSPAFHDPHPQGAPAEGPGVDEAPPVGGVGPEGVSHLGLLRPLSTGAGQDDPRASVAALASNSAHDPVRLGTTPRLWRETVLNRQGISHPGRRGAPPVLGGDARAMSASAQEFDYDPARHDPPASRDANAPVRTAYFPSTAAKWATDGGASVRSLIDNMNPQVKDEAIRGLQHAENNHRLAQRHALSARSVLMHFCWATLSKSAAPYAQEAGYMDMEKSGLGYFVDKALRGEFDKGEYHKWLGENGDNIVPKGTWLGARKATANVAAREKQLSGVPSAEDRGYLIRPPDGSPEMASWEKAHPALAGQIREKKFKGLGDGSPGSVVGYNMRSLGDVLDHWSQPADPQDTGGQAISRAQHLANIVSDPKVSGRDARRKIWESGLLGKIGMQNKVLSFSLGMLGKPDMGVLDIWQARRFLPEAFRHEVKEEQARREAAVPQDQVKAAQEKAATEAALHIQGLGEKRHALDLARQAHRDASDRLVAAGTGNPAERKAAMRAVAGAERGVAKAESDILKHGDKTNDALSKLDKVGDKFKVSPDDVISDASANVCHAYNHGPAGLANYEAWEDMLQQAVNHGMDPAKLVTRDGKHRVKPSNFALHWLSWVGGFDAAVGHRSLDALQAMDNQGLMLRPQDRREGIDTPTTEDRLLRMAQTEVQQGTPAARDYGTIYRRGHIHPNELHKQVWNVPTELIPGSGSNAFGDWIKAQDHDTRARFSEEGSKALEPTMRKIAADHGLAMSQDESFGGFGGHGNANSYALLAPLHHDMPWEHQHAAVRGFAGTLGKALKQDAAVYQKVSRSYARNKDEEGDIHRGYDFRLNRKPTPEEAERIAHHVSREMMTDAERAREDARIAAGGDPAHMPAPAADTGYTLLPNNTARFVDFEKAHPDYMERVARGIWKAGGDNPLHAVGPDGNWDVKHVPIRGGYLGNDWEGKPGGDDYAEWIDAADQARQLYGRRTGGDGGRRLADRLRAEYEAHCADFYQRHQEARRQQLLGEDPDLVAKSWGGDEETKTGGDEQPTDYGDLGPWRPEAAGQRIAKLVRRSPALAGVLAQAARIAPEAHDDPEELERALAKAAGGILGTLDEPTRQQLIRSLSEVIRVVQWDMLHRHGGSVLGARGGDRDGNDPRQGWHGEGPTGRERPRSFHHVAHDDADLPTDPKHDGRHFITEHDPEKVLWSDHLASGALGDDQYAPAQKQMIAHGRPQRTWEYDKETQGRRLVKADDGGAATTTAYVPHDSARQPWEGVAHEAFGHGLPARHAATLGALAHHAAVAGAGRGLPVAKESPFVPAEAPPLRTAKGPQLNPFVHEEANRYVQHHGIAPSVEDHGYAPHDPATARRIADAYDQMAHHPEDPATQRSYAALKDEIGHQWDWATKNMGIKFEPWEREGEPYASSADMRRDIGDHRHLYFFQGGQMPANHPLAEVDPQTGFSANDKFRAIHDLYGHAQGGYEFGPRGEENAWIAHSRMFSDAAQPALTSETRGQNSWVNFGAHLRRPDGTLPAKGEPGYVPAAQRPFAEQRAGLLPEEFWGREDAPRRPSGQPVGKSLEKAARTSVTDPRFREPSELHGHWDQHDEWNPTPPPAGKTYGVDHTSGLGWQHRANLKRAMGAAHPVSFNANGTPRVFYHGTDSTEPFTRFQMGDGAYGSGVYVASTSRDAEQYAGDEGARVLPVHAIINKPLMLDHPETPQMAAHAKAFYEADDGERHDLAWRQGYDGIVRSDGSNIVVRHPRQIKSSIANNGQYASHTPDITKARSEGLVLHPSRKGGGPGSRGGKYWRDGKNHVRYDPRPEGHSGHDAGYNPDQVATRSLDAAAWTAYAKGMANRRLTPRTAEVFREIAQREGGTEGGEVQGVLVSPEGERHGTWHLRDGWRGGTYFEVDTSEAFRRHPVATTWASIKQAAKGALIDPFRSAEKSEGGGYIDGPEREANLRKWHAGSKVVNPDGSPKVVYHGTASRFDTFHEGTVNARGRGIYFTDRPDDASGYADGAHRDNLNPDESTQSGPNVVPVHLRLTNPLRVTKDREELPEHVRYAGSKIRDWVEAQGHDGIHWDFSKQGYGNEYVAFHPHQIKSAIGNRGTFDNSAHLGKSQGGQDWPRGAKIRYRRDDGVEHQGSVEGYSSALGGSYHVRLGSGMMHMVQPHHILGAVQEDTGRTKNLSRWFGRSVVKNGDGTPKRVYHGAAEAFHTFESGSRGENGRGIYFTDDPGDAHNYAAQAGKEGQATYPVHLRLENPYHWGSRKLPHAEDAHNIDEVSGILQAHGHDGVIAKRPEGQTHYMVFHPHQIKSAIGNNGAFSRKSPRLDKSGWRTGLTKPRHGATLLLWVDTPSQEGADMVATLEPTTELTKAAGGDQWRGEARDDSGKWVALGGSEKQVRWANDIRADKLAEMPHGPEREHLATQEADSRYWIDRRTASADQLKYDARAKLPKAVQDKIAAEERAASGATEKTTYDIAASRLPWLDEQFAKLAAKAKRLKVTAPSYEIVGTTTKQVADHDGLDPDATKSMQFHTIKVKGEAPKVNGWVFLGKVEHGEEGNVLSAVPGKSIPAQFRTGGQMCDHCHATRKRTDTFIVQHEKTGEVKQIGRNCLSDFLGGANPEALASQAEWLGDAAGILGAAEGEEGFGGGSRKREAYPIDHFLPYVAAVIKRDGWVSKTKATETGQQATVISAENEYRDKDKKRDHRDRSEPLVVTAADEKLATDALAWARKKVDVPDAESALDDYWWNIAQVVGKSTVDPRRIGLLGSIIPAYQRETGEARTARAKTDAATGGKEVGKDWIGAVGDKLPATVVTVLSQRTFEGDYGSYTRYKLVDTDGHLIMWDRRQSGPEMEDGKSYRITAKINDHREWKGDKETRITNVKAVASAREKALLTEAQRLETERELARQRYGDGHQAAYAAAVNRVRAENPGEGSARAVDKQLGGWARMEDNRDNPEFFAKHPEFAPVRKLLLAKEKAEGALTDEHHVLLRDGITGEVTPDDEKVPASAKKASAKAEAAAATAPAKPKIDRATAAARKAKLASLTEAATAAEAAVKATDIAHRNAASVTYAEQKRVAQRDGIDWAHTVTGQTHPEMVPHERAQRAAAVAEHNASIAHGAALARIALHKAQVALADLGPHSSAKDHLTVANAMREAALALRDHETRTHSGEAGENPSGWRSHLLRLRHEALDTYTNSIGSKWGGGLAPRLEALAKAEKQGIPVPAKELAEARKAIAAVPALPTGSVDKKYTATLAKLTKDHDTKKADYDARNAESSRLTRQMVDHSRKLRFGGKFTPEEQAQYDALDARDKQLSAEYPASRSAFFDASGALNKHEQDGWTKGGGESFWKLLEG